MPAATAQDLDGIPDRFFDLGLGGASAIADRGIERHTLSLAQIIRRR